jgi:hypothetical protein
MSIANRTPNGNTPARTFPSPRLNTSFTRDESHYIQWLDYAFPAGDLVADPMLWPAWTDASTWAVSPDVPQRAVPDAPTEAEYPF